jgi:hypothetical protein
MVEFKDGKNGVFSKQSKMYNSISKLKNNFFYSAVVVYCQWKQKEGNKIQLLLYKPSHHNTEFKVNASIVTHRLF